MGELSLPAPVADRESEFYWRGLTEQQLLLQRCSACQHTRFPAMPGCPYCGELACDIIKATGRATLYSWVVVHHPFSPALASAVPYAVGVLDLAEGCRTVARLLDHQNLAPGIAFEVFYVAHENWTEARFRRVPATVQA